MSRAMSCLTLVAFLYGAQSVAGGEIVLRPSADTRVYQGAPDANFASQQLTIGTVSLDKPSQQAVLLQFDLSGVKGAVRSAVLTLFTAANSQTGAGAGMTIEAHRLTQDWQAESVTYRERSKGERWKTDGGDFDSALVASVTHMPTNKAGVAVSFEITNLVQGWLDKTVPNHGLILCAPGYPRDPHKGELQVFESSENFSESGPEFAPRLVVTTAE